MSSFDEILSLLRDEQTVSAYELCTSGLIQALLTTLDVGLMFF